MSPYLAWEVGLRIHTKSIWAENRLRPMVVDLVALMDNLLTAVAFSICPLVVYTVIATAPNQMAQDSTTVSWKQVPADLNVDIARGTLNAFRESEICLRQQGAVLVRRFCVFVNRRSTDKSREYLVPMRIISLDVCIGRFCLWGWMETNITY